MKLHIAIAAVLLAASAAYSDEGCITASCHQDIRAFRNIHQPVKEGECLPCHERVGTEHPVKGQKTFRTAAPAARLCEQCHQAFGKKKLMHAPVKEGDCLACHKVHGSNSKALLDNRENQIELCTGCHDSGMLKQRYMHGPAAVGQCTQCHDPHESDHKGLLNAVSRDVCLSCHADFAKAMGKAAVVHPPVKNDACTLCHDAHGSATLHVLKKKMPDVCTGCHVHIGKKLASKVQHKPLHETESCGNCHSSHFSPARGLLATDEKGLCLGCHGKDGLGKPPLKNIARDIEGKTNLHGPILQGDCSACHDPHGGEWYRLLPGSYPVSFYTPFDESAYGACLACHNKGLLHDAETTTSTGFRNGKENLHYFHVSRQKGRSCRACHEPHAANGKKLVTTEGSAFGEWKIPSMFKPTATGGSCSPGCHKRLKFDREKPEDYSNGVK